MESILHKLYNGELYPAEQVVPTDPAYRSLNEKLGVERERWQEQLPPEEAERLEKFVELYQQAETMEMRAQFSCGFKLGAHFMYEILAGDYNPFGEKHIKIV